MAVSPLTAGLAASAIGSGLSILGGLSGNAAIRESATNNYNATQSLLNQSVSVNYNTLQNQGKDVNNALGAALADLGYQAATAKATQTAQAAETNVYGQTAVRNQRKIAMEAALMEDAIVQNGQAKMQDVQVQLTNAKYQYDSNSMQNAQNYNNAIGQQTSTLGLISGAISSGVQFGSAAYSFKTA